MKYVKGLRCRECGATRPAAPQAACDDCFGPLEVDYDYEGIAAGTTPSGIESGPRTIWRYAPLLPAPDGDRVDIGAGGTPLRAAPRLAAELGLKKLWLKLDSANPTHSFKDRVVSVALSVARSLGYDVAACASTGNLANAVAAHAAAAGMTSHVFVPADLEPGKIAGTTVYGGNVVGIRGSYDDVNRICAQLAERRRWAFVNVSFRAFYSEGSKTLAFEVAEQLGWRSPDAVVVPVASGSLLTKFAKGLRELTSTGLLEEESVALHGAQAGGCAPVAGAFERGATDVTPVKPRSIAKSLAIGDPADGYYALREVRARGGSITSVPESSVVEGIRLLARTEGVFTETAGGVTIAALERLVRSGAIAPAQETVVLVTGTGLKTADVLGPARPTAEVAASLDAVEELLGKETQ
ncbi:MAG TPA: threonine synthase [Actinomycetota bacterium]|nr:threonine synthase [Actinomycetota bacterium]